MRNKKKIKVTLAMINVLLTAVELYLQWQLSKSSFNNGSNMSHKMKNK